jgi:nucleotide-binding universal stress UspA family protein
VAWKDTRESRRALADALPLLQRALEVVVLEVCPEQDMGCSAARVADVILGLRRHGVTARPQTAIKQGSTADTIMAQADNMGAALIVAGGYGHSRFGEWVFGGVTRTLLEQERRFVLFSH